MNLTPEQSALLDAVRAAHGVKVRTRLDAEAEAARMVRDLVNAAARAESTAVRAALAAGVPKRRIGVEGLGSKDHGTVQRALDVTALDAAAIDAVAVHMVSERFRLLTAVEALAHPSPYDGATVIRVDWPDYLPVPGTFLAGYGAHVALHGFVVNHGPRRGVRYSVVEDDDRSLWEAVGKLPALGEAVEDDLFCDAADRIARA